MKYKTKTGEEISGKEFFKRWKEGMQNITPIQRLTNESRGTFVILLGFIMGTVALFVFMDKFPVGLFTWALILIFVGNTWTTGVRWLGIRQQLKLFKNVDNQSISVDEIFDNLEEENKLKSEEVKEETLKGFSTKILKDKEENPSLEELETDEVSDIKEDKKKDEK